MTSFAEALLSLLRLPSGAVETLGTISGTPSATGRDGTPTGAPAAQPTIEVAAFALRSLDAKAKEALFARCQPYIHRSFGEDPETVTAEATAAHKDHVLGGDTLIVAGWAATAPHAEEWDSIVTGPARVNGVVRFPCVIVGHHIVCFYAVNPPEAVGNAPVYVPGADGHECLQPPVVDAPVVVPYHGGVHGSVRGLDCVAFTKGVCSDSQAPRLGIGRAMVAMSRGRYVSAELGPVAGTNGDGPRVRYCMGNSQNNQFVATLVAAMEEDMRKRGDAATGTPILYPLQDALSGSDAERRRIRALVHAVLSCHPGTVDDVRRCYYPESQLFRGLYAGLPFAHVFRQSVPKPGSLGAALHSLIDAEAGDAAALCVDFAPDA